MGSCITFDAVDQPLNDGVAPRERQKCPHDECCHPATRAVAPRGLCGDQRLRPCISDKADHDEHVAGHVDDPRDGQNHVVD
jgi:hypothetical protein